MRSQGRDPGRPGVQPTWRGCQFAIQKVGLLGRAGSWLKPVIASAKPQDPCSEMTSDCLAAPALLCRMPAALVLSSAALKHCVEGSGENPTILSAADQKALLMCALRVPLWAAKPKVSSVKWLESEEGRQKETEEIWMKERAKGAHIQRTCISSSFFPLFCLSPTIGLPE